MGTNALPIVIESGKAEKRDLDSLPENEVIASVLSSLSLIFFKLLSSGFVMYDHKHSKAVPCISKSW